MISPDEVRAFTQALDALCAAHGVVIDHEDAQGCGLIRKARPQDTAECRIGFYALEWFQDPHARTGR